MRYLNRALAIMALILAAACTAEQHCALDGAWAWTQNGNPGGSDLHIRLATRSDSIFGVGLYHGIGPAHTPDSIAIVGQMIPGFTTFSLRMTYQSGRVVLDAGTLVCPGTLNGVASEGANTYPLDFTRE
jgi:hypothetical protein